MNKNEITSAWLNHPTCQAILSPISEEIPQGTVSINDKEFNFLSEELRKVNTLQHELILWDKVEAGAISFLKKKAKHFRVLVAISFCLQQSRQSEKIVFSLIYLTLFLENWWKIGFPDYNDKRGEKQRINMLNQLIQTTLPLLTHSLLIEYRDILNEVRNILTILNDEDKLLNQSRLNSLLKCLNEIPEEQAVTSNNTNNLTNDQSNNTLPSLDQHEKKSLKQQHKELLIFYTDKHPHPYATWHLRRWKTWYSIDLLPPANEENITQLMANPSLDTRQMYRDRMNTPDSAIWMQLEKSLENSPFWLTGHYISFKYANFLKEQSIARIIQEEASLFVKNFPKVIDLLFSDKTPFADKQTKEWLELPLISINDSTATSEGSSTENQNIIMNNNLLEIPIELNIREKLLPFIKNKNLPAILHLLEENTKPNEDFRTQIYRQCLLAESYEKLGFSKLAKQIYQQLMPQLQPLMLSKWEPSLLHWLALRLSNYGDNQWLDTKLVE